VADRMRQRNDVLWQHEVRRDYFHGIVYALSPLMFIAAWILSPAVAALLLAFALLLVVRTTWRCAWKAPGQWGLCAQYAVHAHFQKVPALLGQFKWRQAKRRQQEIALVDYKQ